MHILTFDIEDWYHFLEHKPVENHKNWGTFENRMEAGVFRLLDILEKYNLKATFFVIGWVAKQNPNIIKEISRRGYEIGMHSNYHQLVFDQSWNEFKEDISENKKIIEDIIGISPVSYRAPGFSIMESTTWAFEIMAEVGIENDSSIFPTNRNHGGFRRFPYNKPCIIETAGSQIREFPINTYSFMGEILVFSGGGYFRLLPYPLIKYFTKRSPYVMSYFHPSDMDKDKPMMKTLPLIRKFRAYYGIDNCEQKLTSWLSDFDFVDIKTAIDKIDWTKVSVMKL
jgi:polysaccharide deacetylase family protein (PEP-CTERM system associated)